VFDSRVMMRIYEPKREEVAGGWRKLHKGVVLHNVYASTDIIRLIKFRSMG